MSLVPFIIINTFYIVLGWQRDFLRDVEPNPGPSWIEIKRKLVDIKLGGHERVAKFCSSQLELLEKLIYDVYPLLLMLECGSFH